MDYFMPLTSVSGPIGLDKICLSLLQPSVFKGHSFIIFYTQLIE